MVLLATTEKGGAWWVAPASARASWLNSCTMGRPISLLVCKQEDKLSAAQAAACQASLAQCALMPMPLCSSMGIEGFQVAVVSTGKLSASMKPLQGIQFLEHFYSRTLAGALSPQ